jgi:serine/threonine-protein kinase
MSPEQARGKVVDRRCDIWSFGAVLFEMLSGRQAFPGEDVSHTLAAMIMQEPDWSVLPDHLPASVGRLLRRCLTKDPKQRLRDIGEARIVIEEALSGGVDVGTGLVPAPAPAELWRGALPWGVAAILALALAGSLLWIALRPAPRTASPMRLSVALGAGAALDPTIAPAAALSRDGNTLAFVARPSKGGPTQLFVRRLDHPQATALASTEDAFSPFFSPDGQSIAFFAERKLKKVSVTGGAVLTLCAAPEGRGGDWGEDGNIVFAPSRVSGLFRVSAAGGTPAELSQLDSSAGEFTHRWPQVLPGGKALLFTEQSYFAADFDDANIMVQSLVTGQRRIVQRGGTLGRYLSGGYLVYLHSGTLFAAPFDLERLEVTGSPVPAVEGVRGEALNGSAQFASSENGTLLYLPGQDISLQSIISWIDRDGKVTPLRNVTGQYEDIRLSPDGRRLAITQRDANSFDIWVYECQRDTVSRFTFGEVENFRPVWTPDGLRLAFASSRAKRGVANIYWQRADGTGEVQRLTENNNRQWPSSWHPDGKLLAFTEQNPQTGRDVMILPLEGNEAAGWKPGKPFVFLNSPSNEGMAQFSPDGRWIAYASDESGRFEVYVRPFPGPGGKWLISTKGGLYPAWSPKGKELFYVEYSDSKIMVADYTLSGGAFKADKPRPWSSASVPLLQSGKPPFDVSPDGKRLAALLRPPEAQQTAIEDHLTFLFNFTDELRRLVPAGKR